MAITLIPLAMISDFAASFSDELKIVKTGEPVASAQ
jgi:hypothetical protein